MYPELLEEFFRFQDAVEDATAKAVVLPPFLAYWLHLRPVARMRAKIVAKLARCVEQQWAGEQPAGIWTGALREMTVGDRADSVTPAEAAELLVGFLFAAHKNPGIGAGQTLLMLLEHPQHLKAVRAELATRGREAPEGTLQRLDSCITETLRLCAHSIGAIRKVVSPNGYTIRLGSTDATYWVPKGSFVAASHNVPHHDSKVFPRPTVFDPARFAVGGSAVGANEYALTTFSHGLHRCPGRRMANALMRDLLVCILHEYDIEAETPIPPLDFERATLGQRRSLAPVVFRRRQGHAH